MLKALLKKQFQSFGYALLNQRKKGANKAGKKSGKGSIVLMAILLIYVAGVFGVMFFGLGSMLSETLIALDMSWLYFTYAAILATVLAVVGSIFMTQSSLYDAKDNELLLSLPIPSKYILLCRMIPLYVQTFAFEALVLIPMYVAYALHATVGIGTILCWVLQVLLLPLLSLGVCCILGWLVALLTSRMRNKNIFTIVLSLLFLGAYFYFYSQLNTYISELLANSIAIGEALSGNWFLHHIGLAGAGEVLSVVLIGLLILAFFGIIYAVLSVSYIRIVTTKRGAKKVVYREKTARVASVSRALLGKEAKRLFGSASYLLNCGLGSVVLLVGTVFAVFGGRNLVESIPTEFLDFLPYVACLAVCFVVSMNCISAPSIALEGKAFWILQTLPVTPWQVLLAKLNLHMLVSAPFAVICSTVLMILLRADFFTALLCVIFPVLLILFSGCEGLFFGARNPNMAWDNEVTVVKQSVSVMLTLLCDWGFIILFGLGGIFAGRIMPLALYLFACTLLLAIIDILLVMRLRNGGEKMFAKL